MTAIENVQVLIDLFDKATGITELSVTGESGSKITIKRRLGVTERYAPLEAPEFAAGAEIDDGTAGESGELGEPVQQAPPAPMVHTIAANRVGVFHPARPALATGDPVAGGQVVGFIESMKLMNEIRADHAGSLDAQLIEDGAPVEYGQPLFHIAA